MTDLLEQNLQSQRKDQRYKTNSASHEKQSKEFDEIEGDFFDLLKNLTILSGTVFASSIALASGKVVNTLFIIGEFFLLISTLSGVAYLWSSLQGKQHFHWLMSKWHLESDLSQYKDVIEPFERQHIEDQVKEYKRLMDKKGLLYSILKIIKIDWVPNIFFSFLTLGLLFILFSISPIKINWTVVVTDVSSVIGNLEMNDKLLFSLSAFFSLIGGLAFGKGLFISKKQAIELGVSRWGGDTDVENLKLPAVKDRLEQRKWGTIGVIFSLIAFILQVIGLFLY